MWKAEVKQKPGTLVARGGDFLELPLSSHSAITVTDSGRLFSNSMNSDFSTCPGMKSSVMDFPNFHQSSRPLLPHPSHTPVHLIPTFNSFPKKTCSEWFYFLDQTQPDTEGITHTPGENAFLFHSTSMQ